MMMMQAPHLNDVKYALPAHCWTHTTHNVGALVWGFQTSCCVV